MRALYLKIIIPGILAFIFLFNNGVYASQFEELDKAPEGAHKGQMFLSGAVAIGIPFGDIITAEEDFVSDNTYTHSNGTIKELLITHLAYDYGIKFEYMPINHIGVRTRLKKQTIVQRTQFGSDYQNWNETLYTNYSFFVGPAFHLTERKRWDVAFTPLLGYAIGEYTATPIADQLINSYTNSKKSVNSLCYGAELEFLAYFSGGFFFSIGVEYMSYTLDFGSGFNLTQNSNTFMDGKTSGSINTVSFIISAGYAFSN